MANVGLGVSIFQKYTHSPAKKKKMRKKQHVKLWRFSLNTNKYKYPKNCPFKIACSQPWPQVFVPHRYKIVPSVYNKNTSKWSSNAQIWSKYELYTPSPPSSMKQCNKSATVKFHMELLLIQRPVSNLAVVRHHLLSWYRWKFTCLIQEFLPT